jgi:hypothetical protein
MNGSEMFPEFDPELHPIGYALAVELLEGRQAPPRAEAPATEDPAATVDPAPTRDPAPTSGPIPASGPTPTMDPAPAVRDFGWFAAHAA